MSSRPCFQNRKAIRFIAETVTSRWLCFGYDRRPLPVFWTMKISYLDQQPLCSSLLGFTDMIEVRKNQISGETLQLKSMSDEWPFGTGSRSTRPLSQAQHSMICAGFGHTLPGFQTCPIARCSMSSRTISSAPLTLGDKAPGISVRMELALE